MALRNFNMEEEHVVYPYDQFEPYITISNEVKENLILVMGNLSHMKYMRRMTIGLLLKIQPMRLLKIFLKIPSMICPVRRMFILRLMKVVKKRNHSFHMIIQRCT